MLANMKMKQFVGHAPKPAHLRRNQVPYDLCRESRASVPESPMMRGQCVIGASVCGECTYMSFYRDQPSIPGPQTLPPGGDKVFKIRSVINS